MTIAPERPSAQTPTKSFAPPAHEEEKTEEGAQPTIGSYLLDRLYALGLRHIFGIPGDYVLSLYQQIEASPIQHIGTTREDSAGFAADAYARVNGIGAACVTYCVGGLNTVNAIACAYAERSPVVLLSGSPGLNERLRNPMLHHMVRDFATQQEVYEKITVAAVVLDDPETAPRQIDRALAALMHYKRPIYLEVPRDLVYAPIILPTRPYTDPEDTSDPDALHDAVADARELLQRAQKPVILAGAEVQRFGLQETMLTIAERLQAPLAATLLGKSVVREDHPLYAGVYGGLIGREEVNRFVDDSDCCLMLGTTLTDIDVDAAAPALASGNVIHATADRIAIRRRQYPHVRFEDFLTALANADLTPAPVRSVPAPDDAPAAPPQDHEPATLAGLFGYLDTLLDERTLVIADVGESLFAGADLHVHQSMEFLSPAYYTSMGFAVPAALGANLAAPHLRPLILVGDGAFQMSGTELSTCLRNGQTPIVVVLNNKGYSTEREILEGPFNDIANWHYEKVCDFVGGGQGIVAQTHGEVKHGLQTAFADSSQMYVLNILLDPADRSAAMIRLAQRLANRLTLG